MRLKLGIITRLLFAVSTLFSGLISIAHAQTRFPSEQSVNGKLVREAFEPQREIIQKSSVVIFSDERARNEIAYGTIISADGYILTKASVVEAQSVKALRVGKELYKDIEVLKSDPIWDVALLKIEPLEPLEPVQISQEQDFAQGQWVVSNGSTTRSNRRVRPGIISANTRMIESAQVGVVIGVMLAEEEGKVVVKELTKDGAAEKGGIKPADVIVQAGEKKIDKRADIFEVLKKKMPGDKLAIELLRDGETVQVEVVLEKKEVKQRMSRNDMMSGGVLALSVRRDNFPRVIHHDTPTTKNRMGGPLLNLRGECIGLNIARASRVATFAIPAPELLQIIKDMVPAGSLNQE